MPKKVYIPRPYIIRSEPTHEREVAISHPPVPEETLDRIERGVQELTEQSLVKQLRAAIKKHNLPLDIVEAPFPPPPAGPGEFTYGGHRYVSLTKLASDIGISLSHLSRILTRQRKPSFPVAIRLADAMGMTLDWLVEYLGARDA